MAYSHPLAKCPIATAVYFEWAEICKVYVKGSKEYEKAHLKLSGHIAKCKTCKEGLKYEQ